MHFAAAAHLVLADHCDVVLAVAGRYACTAPDAAVQVDAHPPAVSHTFHRMVLPKIELGDRLLILRVDHAIAIHILRYQFVMAKRVDIRRQQST